MCIKHRVMLLLPIKTIAQGNTNYKMKIRKIFSLEWCICMHEARMTHTNTFITEKKLSKSIYKILLLFIFFLGKNPLRIMVLNLCFFPLSYFKNTLKCDYIYICRVFQERLLVLSKVRLLMIFHLAKICNMQFNVEDACI